MRLSPAHRAAALEITELTLEIEGELLAGA